MTSTMNRRWNLRYSAAVMLGRNIIDKSIDDTLVMTRRECIKVFFKFKVTMAPNQAETIHYPFLHVLVHCVDPRRLDSIEHINYEKQEEETTVTNDPKTLQSFHNNGAAGEILSFHSSRRPLVDLFFLLRRPWCYSSMLADRDKTLLVTTIESWLGRRDRCRNHDVKNVS